MVRRGPSVSTALVALFTLTTSAFVVTGATGGVSETGQRPFRLNIVTMAQSGGPAWDLYILATQQFQARDQKEQSSYFQIAGESESSIKLAAIDEVNHGCLQTALSVPV